MEQSNNRGWKRGFLTIAVGQTISLVGSSAVQFSLIWWLASETNSPLMLSLAGLLAFLPQLLLGPFVGVWVDRLKRKSVIIAADLFMGVVAAVFAACFFIGSPPHWTACLVLGLRGVGNVFHTPAIQAAIPMLVPKEELVRANGWSQFMQSGAFMLGPVLGALMYAALPMPVILLTDLVGAIAACVTVAVVRIPEIEHPKQQMPRFFHELKEGFRIYIADRRLCILTGFIFLGMIFYMPLSTYYPLMTSSHFGATAWHASIVELAYAGGMLICAAAVSAVGKFRNKFAVIHMGMLGIGVSSLLCGLLPTDMKTFWMFVGLCALMGASGNLYSIPYMAYLQETIPPEAQGRAFSLVGSMMSFTMPAGLLLAGPFAQRFGVAFWFFVSGLAFLAVTALSTFLTLEGRR